MHDLGRVSLQRGNRPGSSEPDADRGPMFGPRELEQEGEQESRGAAPGDGPSPLAESEVTEAAAELLETSEQELGGFLRRVVQRVGQLLRQTIAPAAAQALVQAIQPVANVALPNAGEPGTPQSAGAEMGLELEGLSQEEREFETAKQFVRLASSAAAIAASAPPHIPPADAARTAVIQAAQHFAPGFVGRLESGPGPTRAQLQRQEPGHEQPATSGRWYRRGNQIILVGI